MITIFNMLNRPRIEDIAQKLAGLLPAGTHELSEEIQRNVRALLSNALAKMDLVTREEFDVQAAVLARTRARLEALEKQIAELEGRQNPSS